MAERKEGRMLFSLLFTVYFALCGILLAGWIFPREKGWKQLWLGLVLGLFGLTWLPSLFAFVLDFNLLSNLLGALVMGLLAFFSCLCKKGQVLPRGLHFHKGKYLMALLPILLVGGYLFSTHILQYKDGSYYVGQTTYGDLAMHLGFISSIAVQGTFPPDYSIFPGHAVNYPFLCETSSASMAVLGADLRAAYLIPALYAYVLVILGVYFFLEQWLKKPGRALFGTYLFFVGGGFGFLYFIDRLRGGSTLSALLGENSFATNLGWLLEGYYKTPTNLPEIGLRWVNPIVDMLIPQRATLFGWSFLFPCLYLLFGYAFRRQKESLPGLVLLAGGLPLIHTHSFLALGILSGVYCLEDLIGHFSKKRFLGWLFYGGITVLLAAPQLFGFAFQQAGESGMVRLHFNWANEVDSYLWFYVKNLGWLFLLLIPALLLLSKQDRRIASGALVLWGIAEVMVFQPNIYDNNKLLFVWFLYLCGLSAKLLGYLFHRLRLYIQKRSSWEERQYALSLLHLLGLLFAFVFSLTGLRGQEEGFAALPVSGILTVLAVLGLCLSSTCTLLHKKIPDGPKGFLLPAVLTAGEGFAACFLLYSLWIGRRDAAIYMEPWEYRLLLGLGALLLVCGCLLAVRLRVPFRAYGAARLYALKQITAYVLCLTLFLSGVMTIAREWNSSYQVFGANEIQAAEFIKENTEPDAVFLADYSWHLNPVPVLTGRNIVCGPDLYLYYHGIDTWQRHQDIAAMLENPEDSAALFARYKVGYVYIGSSERSHYAIDEDWFSQNADLLCEIGSICLYRLP